MLTDFYFDEEIFEDSTISSVKVSNHLLCDSWMRFGRLGYVDEAVPTSFLNRVGNEHRQRWASIISHCSSRRIDLDESAVSSVETFNELNTIFSSQDISTVLVADGYKDGVLPDCTRKSCERGVFECLIPDDLADSEFHKNGTDRSERNISKGEDISDIWKGRFEGLCKYARSIAIIDRYLIKEVVKDRDIKSYTSLSKFIELLSVSLKSETVKVQVFSAGGDKDSEEYDKIYGYLNHELERKPFFQPGKIQLSISSCADEMFRDDAHGRLVLIDNHVVDMDNGLSLFSAWPVKNTIFNIKPKHQTDFSSVHSDLSRNRLWNLNI
jgi:hypothetical protein